MAHEAEAPVSVKKPRLSLACNECRKRKVRCDTNYPKCQNCRTRGVECFTSDPKHPSLPVVREWIGPVARPAQGQGEPASEERSNAFTSVSPEKRQYPSTGTTQSVPPTETTSPVHQPHDMFFSHDSTTKRMKMMGASSSACLTRTLNLYMSRSGMQPVSTHFKHGMRHAEEFDIPLAIFLPTFPPMQNCERYIDVYFDRIHRLWPLFDIDATKAGIRQFASKAKLDTLARDDIPYLTSAYLIMSLGADEESQQPTRDGDIYLQAASSLMGHILFVPYLPTVQALLLLTIAFRGRNKDGLAWQTVGMAIRVAQSIGLHRHSVAQPSQSHVVTHKPEQLFHARIWGIACCLDKIMQIESGRPSPIGSVDKDQMMGPEQRPPGLDFLQWNMGIAEFQASISDHIYGYKQGERTSQQLLLETARLDKALLDWSNQLPPEFHPANELYCADSDFHIAVHLSIQYHMSMIALHRAALIAPSHHFEAEVTKQCPNDPARFRLKSGETICVKSARTIARLMMELADRRTESRLVTTGPALLACIVLGIYITKNPTNRMQAADLELLKACASHVRDQYLKFGQNELFAHGVITMYEEIKKYVTFVQSSSSNIDPALTAGVSTNPSRNEDRQTGESLSKQTTRDEMGTSLVAPQGGIVSETSQWTFRQTRPTSEPYGDSNSQSSRWQAEPQNDHNIGAPWSNNGNVNGLQQDLGLGPLPFNDYNVEELWDWMLWTDNSTSPLENLGGSSRWNFDATASIS